LRRLHRAVVDTQFPPFPAGHFTQKQTRPQKGRHAVSLSPAPRPSHYLGLKRSCPFLGAFANSRKARHLPHVYCLSPMPDNNGRILCENFV